MREPRIDDSVRLTQDIPELALSRGDVGVIRSTWFAPTIVFEVEFHQGGHDYQTRTLLRPEQVELDADPLLADDLRDSSSRPEPAWG